MCDCKDKRSLDETLKWKQAIESNAKFKDGSNLPIFLLQNKIDLLTQDELKDELKDETLIKNFAVNNDFTSYMRTSAKMKIGIDETMDAFLSAIIEKVIKYEKDSNTPVFSSERKSIALENPKQKMTMQRLDESQGCC